MSTKTFEIGIPVDPDGFVELECDYCKNRFMLHSDVYKNEEYLHFFCPICGLPNQINTFLCPEVLEKFQTIAYNYALEEMNRILSPAIKRINKSKFIRISTNLPRREPDKQLYLPTNVYELVRLNCCILHVKVQNFDKEVGIYCPICGGEKI